jgi:hypothetical protein
MGLHASGEGPAGAEVLGGWTREAAEQALAARTLHLDAEDPRAPRTLGQVSQEYLDYKRAKGKKSLENDTTFIDRFKAFFGTDVPIAEVTAQQIARYDSHRLTQASRLKRQISPASVNRAWTSRAGSCSSTGRRAAAGARSR